MRERVLEALAQARAGAAPASEHDRTTLELAAAALARDTAAGWGVTENPARLRIQTIDSLCAALTRQMPMLSRFGSQPESIEDAQELYLEAARATIGLVESDEAVAQDIERLLTHLDNDVGRIEGLLAEMLRRRDHWLRHVHGRERVGARGRAKERAERRARARARAASGGSAGRVGGDRRVCLCQPGARGVQGRHRGLGRARPPVPDQGGPVVHAPYEGPGVSRRKAGAALEGARARALRPIAESRQLPRHARGDARAPARRVQR